MKKLILSAVMMMAFVGTSMAKTGEVEAFDSIKQELNWDKADVIDPQVCLSVSIKQIGFYQGCGASTADAVSLAEAFYYDCLEQ